MAEPFVVPVRGSGKPDYSKEIALGQVRPGLSLKYSQTLIVGGISFSNIITPYPWVKPLLAIGGTAHFIDWETGLPTPYDLMAGYAYSIISMSRSADQDSVVRAYFSTPALGIPLAFVGNIGLIKSGLAHWVADIVPFSTLLFDADSAYSHQADFIVENLGGAAMEGSYTLYAIYEAVGTPERPPDKTVRCKFCGHEWVVPRETTYIKCPSCGELNIYCDFSKLRRL